ncbi:MAG: hypothetical protein WCS77_00315, partial [Elusimicrobiaceae bacterium]
VEKGLTPDEIAGKGFSKRTALSLLARMDRAEFKRKQAPPVIKITEKAFGSGRRMPVARGYHR